METPPLSPEQAIAFIKKCKEEQKRILGVDRIFLVDGNYIGDLEEIADFTMIPEVPRDLQADANAACEFIKNSKTENSYFAVVYE